MAGERRAICRGGLCIVSGIRSRDGHAGEIKRDAVVVLQGYVFRVAGAGYALVPEIQRGGGKRYRLDAGAGEADGLRAVRGAIGDSESGRFRARGNGTKRDAYGA